ncbi:MAG: GNAT family N-acetyltransferase, partial [Methanolobus sp.]|nr:GNAT family N-acetyltransferase [Methanolobus sp.]
GYQGQGIGKKLLDHCKSLYPKLELGVYTKNTSAVGFYRKNGFMIRKEQLNEDSGFMEYVMSWTKEGEEEQLYHFIDNIENLPGLNKSV